MRKNTSATKIILLVGRDNWQKDDSLNNILLGYLKTTHYTIKWEDPAGHILYKLRQLENKMATRYYPENKSANRPIALWDNALELLHLSIWTKKSNHRIPKSEAKGIHPALGCQK